MTDTNKNQLWKIIARAECPKKDHNCEHCAIRTRCVQGAQQAADNIRAVYIVTPRDHDSLFAQANLNELPEAEVIESEAA